MNNLNLDNLQIVDQFFEPYPIIIYKNFLETHQLNELQDALSSNTIFDKTVMGNRKTILKGTENFENFIEKNTIASDINNFFENNSVFNFFFKNLTQLNKNNLEYFDFENKNLKFMKNFISRKNSIYFKIKNNSFKILSNLINDCRIYCDFDFSVAGSGYEREPHHDKEGRVLNFLLYINNFDTKNGGNFQIFKYKKNPSKYLMQPSQDDVKLIKNIEPQKGFLVTFLSSPNSLHGVEKILKTHEKRYFFYGSYTSIKKIEWKYKKK